MNAPHTLKARQVTFDLQDSPVHWLPDDPFSSQMINGVHLLLPAGELWFCRVFNKALPLVTDDRLREEVQGFIRQEASHARAHDAGQAVLADNGYDVDLILKRVHWLFNRLLGDTPLGVTRLKRPSLEKRWLILRVGLVAAIEHFTGLLGDWSLNTDGWDNGDPDVTALFRWHLAEEVEHRSVAYDLYAHLCESQLGFYVSRQALMAIVFPLFVHFLVDGYRGLARQDAEDRNARLGRASLLRVLWEVEKVGRQSRRVPTFSTLVQGTLRWMRPGFHPESEGDTQQALAVLAHYPLKQAA
ncbi:metal-dependent hydrolase [Marinobacter sp. R17]|uniref:metal-dependent hydrolase n=1 Tax=Marinobacter sp. R17 TaxID=2484250 RepID=UPI000F4D14C8|nr:metal-dependent hydrolase [Marinobacter sp. R17]ROU02251.1 metal-dependent hydrolase [Marinobacter sp. R17]